MSTNLRATLRRYATLIYGAGLTLILVEVFLYLKHINTPDLDLDLIWLIVAGIPLSLALIFGGYLRKSQALGIKLEASLQNTLGRVGMISGEGIDELPASQKESSEYLRNLQENRKKEVQRICLVTGRPNYYRAEVIREYLEKLPNLKFIEVRDLSGKFQCLLPAKVFGYKGHSDNEAIDRLLLGLEQQKVKELYPYDAISRTIKEDESLLESLENFRSSDFAFLPLLSKGGQFLGIIERETLERMVLDQVVAASKSL
jgi:hypothetical protein